MKKSAKPRARISSENEPASLVSCSPCGLSQLFPRSFLRHNYRKRVTRFTTLLFVSLSLFALLSRRGGGDEEEEEEQQREGKESFSFSKRKDSFVIYNFRNARDLSFESSNEKKTNKNRNVIQFDIKKKKNKPKGHHRASHSITEYESNGEGRGKWRQCDRG